MIDKPQERPASYLSPPDMHRLDWAVVPVHRAYKRNSFGVYLVGSVLQRPDYRDIDLRMIMTDEDYAQLIPSPALGLFLNTAISNFIQSASGLRTPVDFQIQSMTEANDNPENKGPRNAMGHRLPNLSPDDV